MRPGSFEFASGSSSRSHRQLPPPQQSGQLTQRCDVQAAARAVRFMAKVAFFVDFGPHVLNTENSHLARKPSQRGPFDYWVPRLVEPRDEGRAVSSEHRTLEAGERPNACPASPTGRANVPAQRLELAPAEGRPPLASPRSCALLQASQA